MKTTSIVGPVLPRVEVDYNFQVDGLVIASAHADDGSLLRVGQRVLAYDRNDESERVAMVDSVHTSAGEAFLVISAAAKMSASKTPFFAKHRGGATFANLRVTNASVGLATEQVTTR